MLWTICVFNYADRQAIFSVFPLLERELQLTPVQLGLLGSAFAWVYGLMAPLAGIVVDRVKRKTAILGGLHVWSIICMATALSQNFRHLFFFRAAEGLGETFYFPASMSLLGDYHGRGTRSRAMGFHQTSVYVGTIGGGFFAGLIGQHYGWRLSFIVFGGLGVLLGIALHWLLVEPPRGAAERAELAAAGAPVESVKKLTFVEFAQPRGADTNALVLDGRLHVRQLRRRRAAVVDAEVSLRQVPHEPGDGRLDGNGLRPAREHAWRAFRRLARRHVATALAARPAGRSADRRCRRRAVRGAVRADAVGRVVIAALTCWGLFKGLYDANIFASVFDVVRPEARGTAAGFMNAVGWLAGGGSAPLVIGIIAQRESLGLAIALASTVYLAAGALLLLGMRFVKRDVLVT